MEMPGSVRGEVQYLSPTYTEEEQKIIDRRDFITRVKTIALDKLNYNPLINPKSLSKREFTKVVNLCQDIIDTKTIEEIKCMFDDIICNSILCEDRDYSQYPIYKNIIQNNILF